MTSNFRPEVEIRPFRACAMHPVIIIGTVRSLWTWLWGRYHVPQNAFLVFFYRIASMHVGGLSRERNLCPNDR